MRAKQIVVMLMAVLLIFSAGCKSSKKAREAAALKARQEQELALRNQRDAEQKAREEKLRAEQANRELEEKARANEPAKVESAAPSQKLEQYFAAISAAASVASANTSISEALRLFASDQTPVLIIISEQDGQKDYDKPTTIRNYLNYLKDQRKNINRIGNVQLDDAGKIRELELIKDR